MTTWGLLDFFPLSHTCANFPNKVLKDRLLCWAWGARQGSGAGETNSERGSVKGTAGGEAEKRLRGQLGEEEEPGEDGAMEMGGGPL